MATSRVFSHQAEENALKIQLAWRDGRKILNGSQGDDAKKLKLVSEAMAKTHQTRAHVKMRVRIAAEYTEDQIKDICGLVVKHQSPFSVEHLKMLLPVKNRSKRDSLMQKAIRQSWSSRRLKREGQNMGSARLVGGRKPIIPTDATLMLEIERQAEKWRRWCQAALPFLPESLAASVTRAIEVAEEVQAQARRRQATTKRRKDA